MNYLEIYLKHLPNLKCYNKEKGEWKGLCPFHQDIKPSFYCNEHSGLYFCFGCNKSGNIYQFLDEVGDVETKSLIVENEVIKSTSTKISEHINPVIIQQLHKNLVNDRTKLEYLLRERFISFFTIKKFQLGYDPSSDRYAIPIPSTYGNWLNIKLHNSLKEPKSLSWREGNGGARLFPINSTLKSKIVVCEGEFDCLLLHSLGINAVTSTAGAGSWQSEWNGLFKDKHVSIIFDSDNAGISGSSIVFENISRICYKCEQITFPTGLYNKKKLDVTDYVKLGGDIRKLLGENKRK
jgi:DNA primase